MGYAIRFMVAGVVCAGLGVYWLIDGLNSGPMERLLGGSLWKGPLLAIAGIGAFVMGWRIFREELKKRAGSENDRKG